MVALPCLNNPFLPHDAYRLQNPTTNSQAYTVKLIQKGPTLFAKVVALPCLNNPFLPHDAYSLPNPTANSQAYTVKLIQKGLV